LEHPHAITGKWKATLHRGGKDGEVLGQVEKRGFKVAKEVTMA
jgi:hypothetical protein